MSDKALLPCPFCGSEASDSGMTTYSQPQDCWWEDGTPVTRAFFVNCLKCFATTQGLMGGQQTQEKAIAAWNTRVQSTSPGGAEEWALLYLHDWDPKKEDGSQPVYPEIHGVYQSDQEAQMARLSKTNPHKYYVRRANRWSFIEGRDCMFVPGRGYVDILGNKTVPTPPASLGPSRMEDE